MKDAGTLENWQGELAAIRDSSMALAIGVFDLEGSILYLNRGMKAILGGETPDRPRHRYLINPSFDQLLKFAGDGLIFSGWLTVGDGYRLSHTLQARVLRNDGQMLIAGEFDTMELDQINQDLTRSNQQINDLQRELTRQNICLLQTLQELRETQVMLIQSKKMTSINQLIAGIAHEINNPLAFVIANLNSLREAVNTINISYQQLEVLALNVEALVEPVMTIRTQHYLDFIFDDFTEMLDATDNGLDRIQQIIADLHTFSRINQASRKRVDLAESLRSTLALMQAEFRTHQIVVRLELTELPLVECYPAELNQVFMNLIVNAIQAMAEGGVLTISGQRQNNGELYLRFQDTGPGIPHDIIDRVFDPFFTTKPVGNGTGLGLSMSYNIIVKRHGGRIEVESTLGQGATFSLWLPEHLP